MKVMTQIAIVLVLLAVSSCKEQKDSAEVVKLQHFFGTCRHLSETNAGECETLLAIVDSFNVQHSDIKIAVNNVQWPGYTQLASQLATGGAPDIVSMHQSVIYDYSSRHLILPLDRGFKQKKILLSNFTKIALKGVTRGGRVFGLPFDNWMPLWHLNLRLLKKAGLLQNGRSVLPDSPAHLLEQARLFKARTGKPYLIQSSVNEAYATARTFFTLLEQQNVPIFRSNTRIRLKTRAAKRVLLLLKALREEGLTTSNADYTAANAAFVNGNGGVYIVGTWMTGTYDKLSEDKGSALYRAYSVRPFPRLFQKEAVYVDGHAWVVPALKRTAEKDRAIFTVLRFLYDHDREWAGTGHLPAYKSVINDPRWLRAPHRRALANLANSGTPLPTGVQRQFLIQDIVSQEVEAALSGNKTIDDALLSAERRVNDILDNVVG